MTCAWDNPHDHALTWPEEMCVGLMYYGPGRGWLTCEAEDQFPRELGGGDAEGCADHVIDLGHEGGSEGGHLVAVGTPEEVAEVEDSYTGRFLREHFEKA